MPRNRKPDLYNLLKQTGAPLTTTYMKYTTEQLEQELAAVGVSLDTSNVVDERPPVEGPLPSFEEPDPQPITKQMVDEQYTVPFTEPVKAQYPMSNVADPEEMPGQRLNQQLPDDVIRVDDQGRLWYQEEVRKPAYPKPRGRRVLKYIERGVEKETVQNGEYIETFEVSGMGPGRPAEVKITLPSYQVGIYKDPRFPFKIHVYNEREGFNLFEVQEYYGGAELVPEVCKRIYIENDLCYDIRSVVRAIQTEYRQLQLAGKL